MNTSHVPHAPSRTLLAGLLVLAWAGRSSGSEAAPSGPIVAAPAVQAAGAAHPDIVLVTFDTVRRDHVSCYGAARLTTPRIDALAASGVRFTDCQAVVPLTGPSHTSILSGLYPQQHGAFRNGVHCDAGKTLLPGILRDAGYHSAAVVSGWTLKRTQCGLASGFDVYDDQGMDERYGVVNLMRRADAVTDAALAWADGFRPTISGGVAAPRKPYFLFVHYFDPHEPYESPLAETPAPNPAKRDHLPPKYTQSLEAYDREIAFADRELGRLLDGLKSRGLLDDAVVVFTTDHGQAFGDHGYGGPEGQHGRRLYQDNVATPLVISGPGRIAGGRTIDLPTCHLDILPTLLAVAGVPEAARPAGLPGFDLSKCLVDPNGAPPWGRARRVLRCVTYRGAVGNKWNIFRWAMNKDVDAAEPLYACAIADGRKLIVDFTPRHRVEVYDLTTDPSETKPLAADEVEAHDAWAQSVLDWYERTKSSDLTAPQPTGAELENLRSLGYVE